MSTRKLARSFSLVAIAMATAALLCALFEAELRLWFNLAMGGSLLSLYLAMGLGFTGYGKTLFDIPETIDEWKAWHWAWVGFWSVFFLPYEFSVPVGAAEIRWR